MSATADVSPAPIAVVGAASGMGRDLARALAAEGVPLLLIDRDGDALERVAAAIRVQRDAPVAAVVADIADEPAVRAAFAEGRAALGPVGGLAAVAGAHAGGFLEDVDHEQYRRLFDVNVWGLLVCVREAAAQMRARGDGGRIVVWSSSAAKGGSPGYSVYAATKAAGLSLAQSLALELAADGITVNAILPGAIDTPLVASTPPAARTALERAIPLGRWGQPADVTPLVAFLLSGKADYVTGAALTIDGGLSSAAIGSYDVDALRERVASERNARSAGATVAPPSESIAPGREGAT